MFCVQVFDICFHEVSTRAALSADARTVLDTTLSRESLLKSSRFGQFGHLQKNAGQNARAFSAIPAVLDAADRHARVRRRYTVDEDTTGV